MQNSQYYKASASRLATLHPAVRASAFKCYELANAQLKGQAELIITQALRTFAEQQKIYDLGRRIPGTARVTNAKPGQSYHNYGLALDFALLVDGKTAVWDMSKDYDGDKIPDWMEVVKVFKAAGWAWGGDFKSIKDYPHLEMRKGYEFKQLSNLVKAGRVDPSGYVLI